MARRGRGARKSKAGAFHRWSQITGDRRLRDLQARIKAVDAVAEKFGLNLKDVEVADRHSRN
jgi:hypothetical protein